MTISKDSFKKADIVQFCTNDKAAIRKINELKEKRLIEPINGHSKIYRFNLSNSIFLRLIASCLKRRIFA